VALVAADPRRDPVDEALARARALNDERPVPVPDDRLDRLALALAELGIGPEHGLEVVVERRGGDLHARKARHARGSVIACVAWRYLALLFGLLGRPTPSVGASAGG
jgi:hypothetical protein